MCVGGRERLALATGGGEEEEEEGEELEEDEREAGLTTAVT